MALRMMKDYGEPKVERTVDDQIQDIKDSITSKQNAITYWKNRMGLSHNASRYAQSTLKSKISLLEMQITGLQTAALDLEAGKPIEEEAVATEMAVESAEADIIEAMEGNENDDTTSELVAIIRLEGGTSDAESVAAEMAAELAPVVENPESVPSVGTTQTEQGKYEFVRVYVNFLFRKKDEAFAQKRGFDSLAAYIQNAIATIENDPAMLGVIARDLAGRENFLRTVKLIAKIKGM